MDGFGLANGLAVKVPYDQMIQDMRYNNQAQQEAKERAANRAKMFADDVQYNNAMNSFDHEQVNNYVRPKIAELGKWQQENPNWRFDPMKMAEYQNRLRDMKDNEHLQRGMRVDNHIKAYQTWLQDPKNADVKDLPEAQQYKQHLANYLHTGSIDGDANNRQEFRFEAPFEGEDLTPIYKTYGEAADHSFVGSKGLANGVNQARYTVTTDALKRSAEALKSNAIAQRKTTRDYKYFLNNNPDSKLTYDQFLLQNLTPHAKEDKYDIYNYHVNDNGSGGSKGKQPVTNLFQNVAEEALKRNGKPVQASPDGLENLYVGKNGALNLNNSFIITTDKDGNIRDNLPINGGLTKNYSFSGATVRTIKNANGVPQLVSTFKAQMPVDKFDELVGKDVLDTPDWWFSNTTDVRTKYKGMPLTIVKNDDGKEMVEFEVSKPLDYNNQGTHYGYNWGAHGKPEDFSSDNAAGQPQTVTQNGVEYHYNSQTGKYE